MQRTLENKNERRKRLMALPYPEKVRIVEKMRAAAGEVKSAVQNSDFWKQFEGTPRIDCVKMKHDIQAQIYEDTKDMTRAERDAYRQRRAAAFRAGIPWELARHNESLVLKEEPPPYGAKQP